MIFVTEVHRLDDALSRIDPNCTSLVGSTMIAAILEDNRYLSVINVGDSRAVACDTCDQMISLSKDHKPDDKLADTVRLKRKKIAHAALLHDNARLTVQNLLVKRNSKLDFEVLQYNAYSADLAQSDYDLFRGVKLRDKTFDDQKELEISFEHSNKSADHLLVVLGLR
ncbi:hypothetical protein RB195_023951 [Necator americanus]|uniref:PPM-type phosphatase domain-containing protein n=1 Tax=Necator americanus TaxID=51031 RepID=A0ABR1ELC3_NECAM